MNNATIYKIALEMLTNIDTIEFEDLASAAVILENITKAVIIKDKQEEIVDYLGIENKIVRLNNDNISQTLEDLDKLTSILNAIMANEELFNSCSKLKVVSFVLMPVTDLLDVSLKKRLERRLK